MAVRSRIGSGQLAVGNHRYVEVDSTYMAVQGSQRVDSLVFYFANCHLLIAN